MPEVWTDIPDARLQVDEPVRSVDVIALRDNPIALAKGKASAPRIVANAIASNAVTTAKIANLNVTTGKLANGAATHAKVSLGPTAGDTIVWDGINVEQQIVNEASYPSDYFEPYIFGRQIVCRALFTGVIRVRISHRGTTVASKTRVLRNGSVVGGEWSSGTASWAENTSNVSVTIGDVITFQHRTDGTAYSRWRWTRVSTNEGFMAVA